METLDDLWILSQIIETNDIVKARTFRKIKIGGDADRKQETVKKPVFLAIKVEKVEYSNEATSLRVLGTVTQGPEDIPSGSYHTISIEEQTELEIEKLEWLQFQIEKLQEASKDKKLGILICVHDREEAYFALMKKYGYQLLSHFSGNVQKKADLEKVESKFYAEIIKQLHDYDTKFQLQWVILASPAFWKEDLMKELHDPDLKKKIVLASCSSVTENAIHEVLKRPETEVALKQDRIAKEVKMVDLLLQEIAKSNAATYGVLETKSAAEMGAVKLLLLTDSFIQKKREENTFLEIEQVMKTVDKAKGEIVIISTEHEAGKKLNGLGGIAAVLRYRVK